MDGRVAAHGFPDVFTNTLADNADDSRWIAHPDAHSEPSHEPDFDTECDRNENGRRLGHGGSDYGRADPFHLADPHANCNAGPNRDAHGCDSRPRHTHGDQPHRGARIADGYPDCGEDQFSSADHHQDPGVHRYADFAAISHGHLAAVGVADANANADAKPISNDQPDANGDADRHLDTYAYGDPHDHADPDGDADADGHHTS